MFIASTRQEVRLSMRKRALAALIVICAFLLASCGTFSQTVVRSSPDKGSYQRLSALEEKIASIAAGQLTDAQNMLEEAKYLLDTYLWERHEQARIWGIRGQIAWYTSRSDLLSLSLSTLEKLAASGTHAILLKSRVETDLSQALKILDQSFDPDAKDKDPSTALLRAERARRLFAAGQWKQAAAEFDRAFLGLSQAWIAVYKDARNQAFQKRDLVPAKSDKEAALLGKDALDVESLIGLALLRSKALDGFGKESIEALANLAFKLDQLGMLKRKQQGLDASQNRLELAWFLFSLVAAQEGNRAVPENDRRRSASPIADLERSSEFFFAVLGVVRRELMDLRSGNKFEGEATVSIQEYLKALDAYRKLYP